MSHCTPEYNRPPEGEEPEEPFPVFTEPERCPRCKGTGFIGKAVDIEGNPLPAGEQNIEIRITAYLSSGGLFNPELMEHEKVRDLLIDCREQLAAEREKVREKSELIQKMDNAEKDWESSFWSSNCENEQLRSQVQTLVDTLKRVRSQCQLPGRKVIDAALAKIGGGK